jgi:hypothetical protein
VLSVPAETGDFWETESGSVARWLGTVVGEVVNVSEEKDGMTSGGS